MQPSSKYESTEKTGNGFKVKITNDPIRTLFPLNSNTDISIAYTNTSHNEFREICQFFGSGTFNIKPYLRDETKFSHVYETSAGQDPPAGYVDICKLRALNFTAGKYQQTSPYIIFLNATQSSSAHNYYWYGQNEREESANNRNLSDVYLVSDFEVNKAIFYATVRGYTKTEYENYLANGTVVSDHDINLWDFIETPSNYYISHFGMVAQFTWNEDNNRWDAVHTNCRITPALLFNADTAKGITNINNAYFAGTYSGSTETQMSNNVSQSAKHTSRTGTLSGKTMGQLYDQIIDTSWCIGSPIDLELDPDMIQTDWDNNNEATIAFSGSTDKKEYYTDYHYTLFGWEDYSWGYNYGTSEGVPCHCTKYEFHLQRLIKGESVSALMASCGVYVTDTGNLTTFRGYSLTPTSMESSHIKLGEMLPDGSTSGVWIDGPNLDEYTGPNKTGSIVHPSYNPQPPSPPSGDDMEAMATGASGSSGGFTHFYVMSPQDLIDLLADFYDHASSGETISNNLVCSYILGIPSSEFCATEEVPVVIHNSAQGTPFVSQADYSHIKATNNLLVIGSFNVPRMTNTFYDFAPYSTYEVFIPCCGWVSLPDTVAGRSINVEVYIDIASCCLKAAVKTNDLGVCAVTNGVLGAAIPMAVIESGILRGNNIQAGLGIIGGGINTGVGAGSGNAMGIGFGVQQILSGLVECTITGNTNYTQQKGGTGDITQFAMGHKCYMKVTHPDIDPVVNESIFGHSVGYLCNSIGKLSEYAGFTVCGNPHVTFSASAEEREEIERLLSMGVIL